MPYKMPEKWHFQSEKSEKNDPKNKLAQFIFVCNLAAQPSAGYRTQHLLLPWKREKGNQTKSSQI
jgi:hypothetical protein